MQGKKSAYGRAAAQRLLELQRPGELDAEFAKRLGLTSQHIYNYKKNGISLDVLAELYEAGKLSDAQLLRIVSESAPPTTEVTLPPDAVLQGLRKWLDDLFPKPAESKSGAKGAALKAKAASKAPRPKKGRAGGGAGT